jgi:hypothetical protein
VSGQDLPQLLSLQEAAVFYEVEVDALSLEEVGTPWRLA